MVAGLDRLPTEVGDYLRAAFGPFDFDGIRVAPPTRTFSGTERIDLGGRSVELIEVGPAHTTGDVIVWVPDERVVFTGDILFIEGTPIMWSGPTAGWIAACDLIAALEPAVIVPGHGPLADVEGVRTVSQYLRTVEEGTRSRWAAGLTPEEATRDLHHELLATAFGRWRDHERLAVNVETVWAGLEPGHIRPSVHELFVRMAALAGATTRG